MTNIPLLEQNKTLKEVDPDLYTLVEKERGRQWRGLELIASENFTSRAVLDCLGSCLTNKYSEGQVGQRYYGGNDYIDQIEKLCKDRTLQAFDISPEEWDVNVQPYSGSVANFAAYTAVLKPHDRIMGLDLPSGGHLSHGYYTGKKKVSATSIYFESLPYKVKSDGYIDYDELEKLALIYKPQMIVCGGSAYPRDWDYVRLRKVADQVGCLLMCDMAHYAGLVAAKEHTSPFPYCDLVTTTTHKSLRGPRAGLIFSNKKKGLNTLVDFAVFPGCQGGPHNNQIGAIATQMREVQTEEFREYARQIKANARALAKGLMDRGYDLMTGGTDNHLVLWSLRAKKITGSKMEKIFDAIHVTTNKNAVAGDTSALSPYGIRLGTPALTSRGFKEEHFEEIAEILHQGVLIGLALQEKVGKELKDFVASLKEDKLTDDILKLRKRVYDLSAQFGIPGEDPNTIVRE